MAASIASPGRPTPITTCRPAWISNRGCSSSPRPRQLLHAALSRPGYECAPIAMGTNTDPYQPIEERWRITRSVDRGAARDPPSLHHHHQVRPRAARPRPAQAGGGAGHRVGRTCRSRRSTRRSPGRSSRARRSRASAWRRSRRSTTPACPATSRSPRSSRRSPTMSSSISSRLRSRPARRAASICRSACPTKSRPCSAPGSTSIIPTAPPRSWRPSARCAAGATMTPISSAGCAGQGRGPTCSAPGSRSRAKKYGLRQAKFPLRRDLFEPPARRPDAAALIDQRANLIDCAR